MTSQPLPRMTDAELDRPDWAPGDHASFGSLETARGHLPLRALNVETSITGLVARTTLRQRFVNTHDAPLEATYIFPLPDQGAVSRFVLRVAGRVVEGVLKERGEARREYREAIAQGHRAAIAEEERPDTFTMRVGNIAPGEEAEVELTLTAPLPFIDGEATYRFPLVVAPRYIPGKPLGGGAVGTGVAADTDVVPDASRISPPVLLKGYPNPVQLHIAVKIDTGGLPLGPPRSSLHAILSERTDTRAYVEIQPGERVDRDFILRFDLAGEAVRTSCLLVRDEGGQEGTFQLSLMPPRDVRQAQRPRDVIFVLDRSGSMSGWKMGAARRAMARMVDTLSDQDRFNIYAFDNTIEGVPGVALDGLERATARARWKAVSYLAGVEARGGTEMAQPLTRGARALTTGTIDPTRQRTIVLVTDGQVGNEREILRQLERYRQDVSIFTIGIDRAVNAGFLNQLAQFGGGVCELVEGEARLDEVMERIHKLIDTPVVSNLQVSVSGTTMRQDELVPERLPGLFAGAPVLIHGRVLGDTTQARVVVRGELPDGSPWHVEAPMQQVSSEAIGQLWARARLRVLEDRHNAAYGGLKADLEREIVRVSLRHSVLCRFTAFVAVDRDARVDQRDPLHRVTQAVESPEGWGNSAPNPNEVTGAPFMPSPAAAPMPASPAPPPSAFNAPGGPPMGGFPMGGAPVPMSAAAPMPMPGAAPMPEPSFSGAAQGGGGDGQGFFGRARAAFQGAKRKEHAEAKPSFESISYEAEADEDDALHEEHVVTSTALHQQLRDELAADASYSAAPAPRPSRPSRHAPSSPQLTQAGAIVGNPRLLSPEQVRGEAISAASDVHALGRLIFELITREHFIEGDNGFTQITNIVMGRTRTLDAQALATQPRLAALNTIILRATATDQHARLTLDELISALEAWLHPSMDRALVVRLYDRALRAPRPQPGSGPALSSALAQRLGVSQSMFLGHTLGGMVWEAVDGRGETVWVVQTPPHDRPMRGAFLASTQHLGLDAGVLPILMSGQGDAGEDVHVVLVPESATTARLLRLDPLHPDLAAWIILQAARTLQKLHAQGAVHGWLSTAHVRLTRQGEVLIARPNEDLDEGALPRDIFPPSERPELILASTCGALVTKIPMPAPVLPTVNPAPPRDFPPAPPEPPRRGFLDRARDFLTGGPKPDADPGADPNAKPKDDDDFWR